MHRAAGDLATLEQFVRGTVQFNTFAHLFCQRAKIA